MRSTYISTLAWTSPARAALPKLQSDISKATTEIATGRQADVGLALGVATGESVALHLARGAIVSQKQGNALASSLLGHSQVALSQISDDANRFLKDILAGQAGNSSGAILEDQAKSALDAFTAHLNATDGQRYLFAGINSAVKPMADYATGPKAAVDAAFAGAFGLDPADPQGDPEVADISAADMSSFLDGAFADLFADPAWGATWSSASDEALTSRISDTARVSVTTTANTTAMRNLAMAFTMVSELGTANLSEATRKVVLDRAATVAGAAVSGVVSLSAQLGVSKSRVDAADEALAKVSDLVDQRINVLEGVDPAEAKTRLDTMTTQLQMSYATTAKVMQLSILNYI